MQIKSLLLVDDDMDDHELFKLALFEVKAEIEFASALHGLDALQKLERNAVTPDVIFMDINMPFLNGLDTLKELKKHERLQHIQVVMYSTSEFADDKRKAKELGAVGYLHKPSTLREICQLLKSFLNSFRGK